MDKIKITVYLERSAKTELKVYAAKTERSLSDIIEKAILEYIAKHPAE